MFVIPKGAVVSGPGPKELRSSSLLSGITPGSAAWVAELLFLRPRRHGTPQRGTRRGVWGGPRVSHPL